MRVSGATLARRNGIAWEGRKSLRSRTIGTGARMHDAINTTVILLQMRNAFEVKARVRLNLNGQALSVGSWRLIVRHADQGVKDKISNARQTVGSLG